MAEGQFSPDLLLTVGADLTALRQQLATIQREIGATPLNVGIQPQQAQAATRALNDQTSEVKRLQSELKSLRAQQEQFARAFVYDTKVELQERIAANRQIAASDQQLGRQRIQAEREYALARSQGLGQLAGEEQRLRQIQRASAAEDQQLGRQRIQAEKEYALARSQGLGQLATEEQRLRQVQRLERQEIESTRRADEAATLERLRNIRRIEAELARLQTLQSRTFAVGAVPPPGTSAQVGALQAGLGTLQGGGRLSPAEIAALSNETARLDRALRGTTEAAKAGGIGLEGMFGQFGRYIRVAGFLTVVYGGMRAVFSGVQEYIAVDRQLRTIAATLENTADRSRVMRESWQLLVEANQRIGTSFTESGDVLITLQKILGNNTEEIRGAFVPSLALASIAEGNQTEILRVLVGSYQLFGRALGETATPAEKFERVANAIANASVASIQDVGGFTTALQTVIPAARGAGVSLEDTLTLLTLLQNGMQSASRAGTGLARLMIDMQRFAPQISRIFDIPFDVDRPVPVVEMLTQVAQKLREAGPQTTELAGKIREAIPDERAQRALQTFVEQLDKFLEVQKRVAEGGDRVGLMIEEQSKRIEAATGRFKGAIFREFSETINALTGAEFGNAEPIVNAIDSITNAISLSGSVIKDYVNTVLAIPRAIAGAFNVDLLGVFQYGLEEIAITARHFLLVLRTIPDLVAPGDRTRREVLADFTDQLSLIENQVRSRVRNAAREAQREVADLSAGPKLPPPPAQPEADFGPKFSSSLIAEAREIQQKIQAEFYRNRTDLPLEFRITNARHVLAEAEKVARETRAQFERGDFPTANDRDSGARALETALRKVEQARGVSRKLDEEALGDIFKRSQIEEKNLEQLEKEISLRAEIDTRRRAATGDETAVTRREREVKLLADLNRTQDETVRLEIYEVSVLQSQEDLRQRSLTGIERGTQALRQQLAIIALIAQEAGVSPEAAQTAEIDRAFGIDKLVDSTRELAAAMGLVGAEAARAAVAAKQGFESFEEMVVIADRARARVGPTTRRERDALTGVEAGNRIFTATQENQIEQAKDQVKRLDREQRALSVTFGQTTEEATRQSIAIRNTGKTFEELTASVDTNEQAYALLIARIAKLTAESREQVDVLSLMAAGFDEVTAKMIVTQNEADRLEFEKLRRAGESLEEFNTRAERMRDAINKIGQEVARANGDPFAFFVTSLRRASDAAGGFWDHLKTLAEDTARSMSQSLSDFFFNTFEGKLNAGKDAWKSFLSSMERALADFMSKQLVKSFLNLLLGGGGEGAAGGGIAGLGGAAGAGALGGIVSGFGSLGANYTGAGGGGAGISAALFGLPATPQTVQAGLQPSNPDLEFAGLAPTSLQTLRPATSGLLGTGGQVSRELASAGVIAAAYTAASSVIKLTNEIATEQDRNSGIGGITGGAVGGIAGAFFGGQAGAAIGAGAGGLLGSYLGGLFGSNQAPAGRFDELSQTIGTVQTSLEAAVNSAQDFTQLYQAILSFQGGGAGAAATRQPVQVAAGGVNAGALSAADFFSAIRQNPAGLTANVQAGVNPSLLAGLNQEVAQTILAKVAALDAINQQITQVIAEISAQSIAPATGVDSLETLQEQAAHFRAVVDQLVSANEAQVSSLESLLRTTTDPAQILQYTTQIKALIEERYRNETQLVQQFAGQLDSLATSLKNVGESIEEQIFQLQLSNFGPTNPLQGYQLAQGRFDAAQAAFAASPTAENAQAVQAAVDPLLKAASEVFTRPSPEYRAIFAEVIDALQTVKISVDSQAADIQGALQAVLGTSVSIQDLTQRNTAAMAADMHQLLAVVRAQAAAAGVGVNAGTGVLNPQTNPPPSGPVTAPTAPVAGGGGSQSGALLAAVGTIGALAGPLITIADKLGATDYLKNLFSGIFSGLFSNPAINPATAANYFTGGGGDVGLIAPFADYSYTPYDYGYLAEGGPVPGSGMGDTVRAMLEPGEFVVRRDAAARNRRWLEEINGPGSGVNRRGILHFQTGGMVPSTTSGSLTSPENVAILLYLQSISGATTEQAQVLLTALIRQAEMQQSAAAAPSTPSTVPSTPSTTTPSLVESDPTIELLRQIQGLLGTGKSIASLFSSGGLLGDAFGVGTDAGQVLGSIGSGLGIAAGSLGLFTGIANDDPFAAATGGVQLAANALSLLSSAGIISGIPNIGPYAQAVLAAIQIAQIASSDLSDEEKAIQAARVATTAIAVALSGPTFGASYAVLQIWDFVDRIRAGQPLDQALVSANDPTTLLNILGSERDLSISGALFAPSKDWVNFIPNLYDNANTQGEGFEMLLNALPYVKSKKELGQLLNAQKNWVSTITGIPLSAFGGADSPYSIQTIPGIGPETHGQETVPVDWAETSNAFQQLINVYKALLPGMEITGGYGSAEGSFSPEAYGRLWSQFRFDDPGWFSYATYAGAPMPFDVQNLDTQFVNTSSNESGANFVPNPNWIPYGTAQVYDGVDASGKRKFTSWTGWQPALGIRFDPQFGDQVWVAPGGPIPQTIESLYAVSPEWKILQALYGLPPVVPIPTPGGGLPQPTGYVPATPEETATAAVHSSAVNSGLSDLEYILLQQQLGSQGGAQAGGWVPGVSQGRDSVHMMLEPGEFVVPRAVAKANSELLMGLLGDGGGAWDMDRAGFGQSVSSMAHELVGGSWDGLHRADAGSTISTAARSGDYRGAGGVSSVALNIAEGAIRIDGARDPKVVSRDVLEAIEQNIRTGRLGQVIASRVRPQRTGV